MSEPTTTGTPQAAEGVVTPEDVARYHQEIARFARRRSIALFTGVACTVVSVLLVAMGAALLLGSMTSFPGAYVAQRHAPGTSGSISISEPGRYVITKDSGDVPSCSVTTADGQAVAMTKEQVPRSELVLPAFDAVQGGYTVTCEGGQARVVVFAQSDLDLVFNGWASLMVRALPFIVLGVAVFLVGRFATGRIAPESMRPMIPS